MRLIPASVACLLLPLVMAVVPVALTSCGGDRYSCDACQGGTSNNPDDTGAEDTTDLFAGGSINVIESAKFNVVSTEPTALDDFSNYTKINFQFGTYAKAALQDFDKDNEDGNLMPISAALWDDTVKALDWSTTVTSDLDNKKLRSYYTMNSAAGSEWTLLNDNNQHKLRVFDTRIYEIWLGLTIKWEVFAAHKKGYPDIAGKDLTFLAEPNNFVPPILADVNTLQSILEWGKDASFTDVSDTNQAAMFVFYKQFRPIDAEGIDLNLTFVAVVPQVATNNADNFVFSPVGTELSLDEFVTKRTSQAHDARVKVNETLFVSFGLDGSADLWDSQLADAPAEIVNYTTSADGSFIRINIPMADKVAYGLETYENPIFVLISDGVNDGVHLGWLYETSSKIEVDNPQPHYAFNDVAVTDMKAAFKKWRIKSYCDDSSHSDDPGRAKICATVQ